MSSFYRKEVIGGLRTGGGLDQMRAFAERLVCEDEHAALLAAVYMLGRADANEFHEVNGSTGPIAEAALVQLGWLGRKDSE